MCSFCTGCRQISAWKEYKKNSFLNLVSFLPSEVSRVGRGNGMTTIKYDLKIIILEDFCLIEARAMPIRTSTTFIQFLIFMCLYVEPIP